MFSATFSRDEWDRINWLLVGFGQQICLPISPKCHDCLNKTICPVGRKLSKTTKFVSTEKNIEENMGEKNEDEKSNPKNDGKDKNVKTKRKRTS